MPRKATRVPSASGSRRCAGWHSCPSRLHSIRSALGATALVWSSWSRDGRRTTSSRSVGRGASSSCARTAIRRASARESSCTATHRGYEIARVRATCDATVVAVHHQSAVRWTKSSREIVRSSRFSRYRMQYWVGYQPERWYAAGALMGKHRLGREPSTRPASQSWVIIGS